MRRNVAILALLLTIVVGITAALGAIFGGGTAEGAPAEVPGSSIGAPVPAGPVTEDERARLEREHAEMLDRDFPLHGLVTKTQITVRANADSESTILGWLRIGAHVRARRESTQTSTCRSGWYAIYPRGWACAGQGVDFTETAPADSEMAPDLESALPYRYLFVKEQQVPEYHQLPSREDQRAAQAHAERYVALLEAGDERRAQQLREGRLAGEPPRPPEVARFLDHGFFVASNGVEVRSRRRFVRTVRGSYIKEAQLEERTGSQFAGIELGGELTLPQAWLIRAARPMVRSGERVRDEEGVEPIERLARVTWVRRERVGDQSYHVIRMPNGDERHMREWFVALAEPIERPRGIADDEPWVHVDLSSQTLVVYRGRTPIYATLVSSGTEGHETPIGEFTIRRKMVTDTMADLGSSELGDDRYRIEDVPWTQYFDGSIALHAAFWHGGYGIVHSHGCVNLSPRDAQYVYRHTWPEVPEGWHGVSTEPGTGFTGSRVIVTQ